MQDVLLSIITPCHNIKYFNEFLASIKKLDINFELIVIDDFPNSKELEKLNLEEEKYTIIKNENKIGAGLSRNKGIEQSKGKFIIFVDADDMILPRALKNAVRLADDNDVDILYSPLITLKQERKTFSKIGCPDKKYCGKIYNPNENFEFAGNNFNICTSQNIYKRSFILENNLFFPNFRRLEDISFVKKAVSLAKKILLNESPILIYRDHNNSTKCTEGYPDFLFLNYKEQYDFYIKNTENKVFRHFLTAELNNLFIDFMKKIKTNSKYNLRLYKQIHDFSKQLDLSFFDKKELKKQKFYPKYILFRSLNGYQLIILNYTYIKFKKLVNFLDKTFKTNLFFLFQKIKLLSSS